MSGICTFMIIDKADEVLELCTKVIRSPTSGCTGLICSMYKLAAAVMFMPENESN